MKKFIFTLTLSIFISNLLLSQNNYASRTIITNPVRHATPISSQSKSSPIWQQGFENFDDFTLDLTPWATIDGDEGTTYGITGVNFPNAGTPMAYIVFNPAATTPSMAADEQLQAHNGDKYAACFSATPPDTNDDWLITPQLVLGNNSFISFWVKSYTDEYGLESYNISVSTDSANVEDFDVIYGPYEAPADAWEQKTLDLSAYNYDTVYLAIHCVSEDRFIFMLDDIVVDTQLGLSEIKDSDISIYPNPANEFIQINSTLKIDKFEIFDLTGKAILSGNLRSNLKQIDLSMINQGIYILKLYSKDQFKAFKIKID
jgi:hypothetical protein